MTAAIEPYFLIVSRLQSYKRIDLAVQAASRLGLPLRIVGRGPDEARLRALAGPTVEFLGRVPDAERVRLLQRCTALIVPGSEDFGLTALEAQAAGRPVIAYGAGGSLETVVEGQTGCLLPTSRPWRAWWRRCARLRSRRLRSGALPRAGPALRRGSTSAPACTRIWIH